MSSSNELVRAANPMDAIERLAKEQFCGIHVFNDLASEGAELIQMVGSERLLEEMPDGVVLLDADSKILWANRRMCHWWHRDDVAHEGFYTLFGDPEILGPSFCPFSTALATCEPCCSKLRTTNNQYFEVHASPIRNTRSEPPQYLIISVRDITQEMLQQQKLAAIHKAGAELADLKPDEIFDMQVEERIELLKSNILHHTKDLLKFDVVEIRLLDQKTGELMPLLAEGMTLEAAERPLFALPQNNGVTGYVAATGRSYLCEDTTDDPLYIEGCEAAKSSLTVPLIEHDVVIGTFNVESPKPGAFTESDRQFLEIFSRDVAVALNTLELLVAQQANTAQASVEEIHREVALPVDAILNDAVNVMERYIGHEPEVVGQLQRILRNARDIKQVIHKVGQKMTPAEAVPESPERSAWPRLSRRCVLVADADESVRSAAHALLERYGCEVETARTGAEAVYMVRNRDERYDVIIADVRLPDLTGYDLLVKLQGILSHVPLVLMSGFGYDPGHSIVKARQAGLRSNAVLYKPFRLDQLLETVDSIIEYSDSLASAT
ncbi:MAG: response regulator [Planctomycetales bacterium]|nr:response regulator [Planctomycetales bacterium]